jgi:2,4-didehydro-3-deoxy-L-rhamnonate hydrolase
MKLCRFNNNRDGVVLGNNVYDITEEVESDHAKRDPDRVAPLLTALEELKKKSRADTRALKSLPLDEAHFLSPIAAPGKIIGAPLNYAAHIREMAASGFLAATNLPTIGEAGLFLKASSSLVGPSQGIQLRFPDRRTDFEIELVVVIGRKASEVTPDHALDYAAGYCIGLDVTLRGHEDRSFRKSIDSYSVIGPWLTTADEIPDPQSLHLRLRLNGSVRQEGSTSDMVYGVAKLISYASTFYTLYPGDLIFTGTPQGVSPLNAGDLLEAECTGLGRMSVSVSAT